MEPESWWMVVNGCGVLFGRILATGTTHGTGGQRLECVERVTWPAMEPDGNMNSSTIDNTSSVLGATWTWSTT